MEPFPWRRLYRLGIHFSQNARWNIFSPQRSRRSKTAGSVGEQLDSDALVENGGVKGGVGMSMGNENYQEELQKIKERTARNEKNAKRLNRVSTVITVLAVLLMIIACLDKAVLFAGYVLSYLH